MLHLAISGYGIKYTDLNVSYIRAKLITCKLEVPPLSGVYGGNVRPTEQRPAVFTLECASEDS